jgi:hypothetical protein
MVILLVLDISGKKKITMKSLFTILLLLVCYEAFPCLCEFSTFEEDVKYSSHIFSGLIISKEDKDNKGKPYSYNIKYKVVVWDSWKGNAADTIDLYSGRGGGDCGFLFDVNKAYMIWAKTDEKGFLTTNSCIRTCLIDYSMDFDILNYKFKGTQYDTTYLSINEIKTVKNLIKKDSVDLTKTVLFCSKDKMLTKWELIDAPSNARVIEFIKFPPKKLKFLPETAIHGVLIVKNHPSQKIRINKIIRNIKKSSL